MCSLHGSKDISLCQHMMILETDKVGAGTFGHPVCLSMDHCIQYAVVHGLSFKKKILQLSHAYQEILSSAAGTT